MTWVFVTLLVLSVISFLVGLIKPTWFLPFKKRTRFRVIVTYVPVMFISLIGIGATGPQATSPVKSVSSSSKDAPTSSNKVASSGNTQATPSGPSQSTATKPTADKPKNQRSTSTPTAPSNSGPSSPGNSHHYKQFSQDMMGIFVGAVESGNTQSVQKFLDSGMDPNIRDTTEDTNMPDMDLLSDNIVISTGGTYDPNARTGDAYVPVLMIAVDKKETDIVNALLKAGADPNINVRGMSALLLASINDDTSDAKALLNAGADPNIQEKDLGYTPLSEAVDGPNASLDSTELLLANKANPNVQDNQGDTPLMGAITYGYKGGFFTSSKHISHTIISDLLKAGANPNSQDKNGYTALMVAASSKDTTITQDLLSAQANPSLKNNGGSTALDIAQSNGNNDVATLLLNANLKQ